MKVALRCRRRSAQYDALDFGFQRIVLVGRLHGVIVEAAEAGQFWRDPQHAYKQQLLAAVTGVGEMCG